MDSRNQADGFRILAHRQGHAVRLLTTHSWQTSNGKYRREAERVRVSCRGNHHTADRGLGGAGGEVRFWRAANDRAQAQRVAAELERLIGREGVAPEDCAVLVRSLAEEGQPVAVALADLEFSRKRIARDVRKCLESAIANAENNHDLDVDDLVVVEAHVGKSLVIKRHESRGRGRVGAITKPFAHLTIVVREVEAATQ